MNTAACNMARAMNLKQGRSATFNKDKSEGDNGNIAGPKACLLPGGVMANGSALERLTEFIDHQTGIAFMPPRKGDRRIFYEIATFI